MFCNNWRCVRSLCSALVGQTKLVTLSSKILLIAAENFSSTLHTDKEMTSLQSILSQEGVWLGVAADRTIPSVAGGYTTYHSSTTRNYENYGAFFTISFIKLRR